ATGVIGEKTNRRSERSSRFGHRRARLLHLPLYGSCFTLSLQRRMLLKQPYQRAPPARRIASCARSYVCFGPIIPGDLRALATGVIGEKTNRRSERSSRCAAQRRSIPQVQKGR
ncbi:hypothetical protein, partial [Pseudomonas sp.]|uniref:hypothetical protein n=1 Tax=Pseudomonas sp. TaxID=306 RepID=UPI0028A65E46